MQPPTQPSAAVMDDAVTDDAVMHGAVRDDAGRALGPLSARVLALCAGNPAGTAPVRAALSEPLCVAVAGRVSAGKSTLVNALLGRRIAATGAGETTRVTATYRHGTPERVEALL